MIFLSAERTVVGTMGKDECPSGYTLIKEEKRCIEAGGELGYTYKVSGCWDFSKGCFTDLKDTYFNTCDKTITGHPSPVCERGDYLKFDKPPLPSVLMCSTRCFPAEKLVLIF